MKRFISLLLTVVMVMSMIIVPATAVEGNAAVFYDGAYVDVDTLGTSWFNYSYAFIKGAKGEYEYVKRVNDSGADHYGGFNYTQVFDFKVTDYGTGSDHFTDFTFSNDITNYHYGYSFTHKAFVVYDMYMPGFDPNGGHFMLAQMSYDLKLDTWYEMAIRFVDKTITIYLNGVEMLSHDLTYGYNTLMGEDPVTGTIGTWDWTARDKPQLLDDDMLFFTAVDMDMYLDNMSFYSGDYDIATGTATTTYKQDADFADMSLADGANFCDYSFNSSFTRDPNGGTEKVTYDRAAAAAHEHEWVLNEELCSTVHCLIPGYDLYECTDKVLCGASEQRNYVAPLGHLPGYTTNVVISPDAENSGVENRICTRDGCNRPYTSVTNLTDTTNGALHGYTDGGSSIYNGTIAVSHTDIMAVEGGATIEMDIMPIAQTEGKDFARIGATMGGNGYTYFVGYKYDIGKFVITYDNTILAESDKTLNNYEWARWTFVRDDLDLALYIDGEKILSAEIDPAIYVLDPIEDADKTLKDCHSFQFAAPAVELLVDNLIFAAPDFDFETRAGVIYSSMDFNGDTDNNGGWIHASETQCIQAIGYFKAGASGYIVEPYGRPMESVTEIHQDRAMLLDSDYEAGSAYGYASLWAPDTDSGETGIAYNDLFAANGDLELSYDFYVYDWCTDPALLDMNHADDDTKTGSAYIGSLINGDDVNDEQYPHGNGFAGYDFIKQQVVIGSVSSQSGGYYGDNNIYADYTVEKETWHNMAIRYDTEYVDDKANGETAENYDNDFFTISVYMDGELVLSNEINYWDITPEYLVFFPNYIKGYFDNITLELNGVVYDDAVDFTNAYSNTLTAMDFSGGKDWIVADGGVPTHVYEEEPIPASCLTDGWTNYTCSCGESAYTLYNLPATGHEYDDGVVTTEPSGTTEGIKTYTCALCGDTYTESIGKLFTYGDVDGSGGEPNNADLSLFRRYLKGAKVNIIVEAADVDGSGGEPNNADLSLFRRFLKGAKVTLGPKS